MKRPDADLDAREQEIARRAIELRRRANDLCAPVIRGEDAERVPAAIVRALNAAAPAWDIEGSACLADAVFAILDLAEQTRDYKAVARNVASAVADGAEIYRRQCAVHAVLP